MQKPATLSPILHQTVLHAQPKVLGRPITEAYTTLDPGRPSDISADVPIFRGQNLAFEMPPAESVEMARQKGFDAGITEGREEGLKSGRDEGMRQGYEDGFRKGTEQAREAALSALQHAQMTLQTKEQQIACLLDSIPAAFARRFEASEDDMVALVHEAACRILGNTFASSDGARLAIRQAISQTISRQLISIRMHPEDFAMMEDIALSPSLKNSGVSLEADQQVLLGGCLIDTPEGTIDARLEVQLKEFTKLLLKVRAEQNVPVEQETLRFSEGDPSTDCSRQSEPGHLKDAKIP